MQQYCVTKNNISPKETDWTTNRKKVLQKLLIEKNCTLYEADYHNPKKITEYRQYSCKVIRKLMDSNEAQMYFLRLKECWDRQNNRNIYENSVIGHGNGHGNRVAWLCTVISAIKSLPLSDTVLLILAGFFHDIGRSWENLNDQYHGEKSFEKLILAIGCTIDDYYGIAHFFNCILWEATGKENLLSADDIFIFKHIITIHSLDELKREQYSGSHKLYANERFIQLSMILDDSDALDRVRFGANLDIRFLRGDEAKRLIHYAAQIQDMF